MVLNETQGSLVEKLQAKLGVPVTGTYDRPTKLAIMSLQQEKGLPLDGIVNEDLWVELFGSKPKADAPKTEPVVKFNPEATDGDKDGFVQDGTIFERAVKKSKGSNESTL